jgi:hypothetical protein
VFHKASAQAIPSEHLPAGAARDRPGPGFPRDLRLDDAGDAKPAWITLLTTEHYNLQMQRVATISEAVADEGTVVMLSARWQPFQKMLSVAGSVAVITSVVLGGDVGVVAYGVSGSLALAIGLGTAAGAATLAWATWYQWGRWCQASPPPPEPEDAA